MSRPIALLESIRVLLPCALLACLLVLGAGCRDHDGDGRTDESGDLTKEENDIRVGREIERCGVQQAPAEVVDNIQDLVTGMRATGLRVARGAASVNVPVVFHIISSGSSSDAGNIPDSQIAASVDVLNRTFAAGFGGSDTAFRFFTAGVTRTVNSFWAGMTIDSPAEQEAKAQLRQGGAETLNVYIAAPGAGLLGWATFPWSFAGLPANDGVVISFETVPGGRFAPYNQGITLTHEVGHWLGLLHTFQDACSSTNDTINDTPSEDRPAFGCPVGRNTCTSSGTDPVNNYMNYSDDFCLVEFTGEQAARMDFLSQTFRGL